MTMNLTFKIKKKKKTKAVSFIGNKLKFKCFMCFVI